MMPYFADNYRNPRVTIFPIGHEVKTGDTVQVTSLYSGEPPPVARWLKDGREVSNSWTDGRMFATVELKDVNESFVLTCLADNGLDAASVHVFVNVTSGKNNNPGLFTVVYQLATRLLPQHW